MRLYNIMFINLLFIIIIVLILFDLLCTNGVSDLIMHRL